MTRTFTHCTLSAHKLAAAFLHHPLAWLGLLTCSLLSACSLSPGSNASDLCILYTTDTHSMICPYDFRTNSQGATSLTQFATLVNEQRAIYGDRCLVFDNGNKLSGGPTAYYYKFADTISEPLCYRAERLIRYDAVGVGAHDIEIPECLMPHRHDNHRQPPTLCANLINRLSGQPIFPPFTIYERGGITIAVLGMIAPTTGDWLPNELWNQYETQDMIECARHWLPIIRQQYHPDVIIGLFSSNVDYTDPANDCDIDTYKNPSGALPTAIRVPGFDLVLLGNSDTEAQGQVRNDEGHNVVYLQAGNNSRKAGMVRIHLQRRPDGSLAKRLFSTLIDLSQYTPDPVFRHSVQDAQDSIFLTFNRPIGYLKQDLVGMHGIYGPDSYRELINNVQLWATQADISVTPVIIPHDTVPAGQLTLRQVFDIYPQHHQLQQLTMTGEEVRRFLEWGYACQFETMHSPADQLLLLQKDVFGHTLYNQASQPTLMYQPTSYVAAGGIRYSVDVSKPAGERVTIHSTSSGQEFDLRNLYRVVINSDLLRDEGKFISRGLNWDREELSLHAVPTQHNSMRKVLYDYIRYTDTLHVVPSTGWDIQPAAYWSAASTREMLDLDPIW